MVLVWLAEVIHGATYLSWHSSGHYPRWSVEFQIPRRRGLPGWTANRTLIPRAVRSLTISAMAYCYQSLIKVYYARNQRKSYRLGNSQAITRGDDHGLGVQQGFNGFLHRCLQRINPLDHTPSQYRTLVTTPSIFFADSAGAAIPPNKTFIKDRFIARHYRRRGQRTSLQTLERAHTMM